MKRTARKEVASTGRDIIASIHASVASCSTPSRLAVAPAATHAVVSKGHAFGGAEHGVMLAAVGPHHGCKPST